ncbi:MAG: T9SS type A sorting domain-containing protein [Bacteroidetes bacterium]|nr:T9SS type A sorting domain-containing protein [Bacteroidota bacterium]HET6243764.1 M43 family zinc metalloprotease [Bacteroidia bacterium]
MMKKLVLNIFAFSLFSAGAIFAQRTCGTMENLELLRNQDPSSIQVMEQIEEQTKQFIAANGNSSRAVYNIPVVVHVVYNTTSQNISDAQIQSQIKILNDDFRRLNADKSNTPSTFTSVAADSEINFCMATKDPNGATTTGITRTSTSVTSFDQTNKMKYNSSGGKDAWPAGSYMNIWVCNLGGGLLGYAQFPGSGSAATDGVVVGFNYFGNTGTVTAPFNKGRTATHEVGHWLNLRHIWGDASCGNDLVSDTPVHTTSNAGCPSHPKSNTCGTTAEMHMNYMDYTDDACMNMFTLGQKTRMQAVLASGGARASLAASTACSGGSTTPVYCSAKGTNTAYEWISSVKLNTINNSTGANGGYADFTAISTNLELGKAYTVSLTPGFAGTAYSEYFKVFIDWNNDSDFVDAGELVYTSAGTTTAVSGSFTVPSTAKIAKTRMRIIMKDGAISGPCEQFTYGEVEDYSVNIVSAVATCATPGSLTVSSITTTGATLGWASTGATSYNVRYKTTASTTWTNTTSTTNSRSVSGLTASTQYEFQVQGVCSSTSSSSFSASKTFSTTAATTTTSTLTVGAGTGTSAIAPYGTYYMDERVQFIITKAELDAAGYSSSNNVLKSLGFNIVTLSSQAMNAFTIKIAHASAASFGTSTSFLAPAMTTVYSTNFTPVTGWNTHNFSTPFSYNGTGNLLIDICWNNSSYTTDSKVAFTSQSTYKTLYKKADIAAGGVCANTTGSLSYERPNIRLTLSSSATSRMEESELEEVELISVNENFDFSIYPNPVTTDLSVSFTLKKDNSDVIITIYNLMGAVIENRILTTQSIGVHSEKMNLSGNENFTSLSNGIYLLSINIDGQLQTKRFVLSK